MASISFGGERYTLATEKGKALLRQSYVAAQSSPIRTTGVTLREHDPSIGHYIFRSFPQGLGWTRMDRLIGRGSEGLRDATCDTRFRPCTLGRLHESQTHAVPLDHPKAFVNWNNDLYCLFEQDYASGALTCAAVASWDGATDTWGAPDCPLFNAASSDSGVGTSLTLSHTVQSTYGNRALIVIAFTNTNLAAADFPTGITYAGTAMTRLGSASIDAGDETASLWYLVNPTTGANNVVASTSGSMGIWVIAMDYYFVNQTTPVSDGQTNSGTATSTSMTAVTTTSGDLVVGGVMHMTQEATTVGAGQVELNDLAENSAGIESSEERAAGTSVTWSASWATSSNFVAVAAALQASGFVTAPETTVAHGVRAFAMAVHKGALTILASRGGANEQHFQVFSSTNGTVFTPYTNLPAGANNLLTTTITRRNNFDDDEAKMLDFGNLLIVAIYDDVTDDQIEVYSTSDSGGTAWTSQGTARDRHVHALLRWKDPYDLTTTIPILVTERNVYKVDTTNNSLVAFLPDGILTGDGNDGRGATIGLDGHLYLPLASGHILKVQVVTENAFVFTDIGPPGDGLVTARQGHCNMLIAPAERWLIAAYGGHAASRNASLFALDYAVQKDPETGKEYQAWHSLYSEGDANIDLYLVGYSINDDSTARLHFALENASSAEMFHIEEPFVHPLASTTIKYQSSSYLRLPTDDLGDPHTTATFFQARVDADDLSASTAGEYIALQDGLDGNADTTNTRGNFLSGNLVIDYPDDGTTSRVGVAGAKIASRLTFNRDAGDTTDTPLLYEVEIEAENRLVLRRAWDFTVDIEATARETPPDRVANTPIQETIIANLETAAEATTLQAFQPAQSFTETLVRVPNATPPIWNLEVAGSHGQQLGYRTGTVTIHVEEVR